MGGLSLPGLWLFLAVVIAGSIAVAVGSVWLADKTVYRPGTEQQSGSLSPFVTVVGLVYGALLGFTVVVAWEQFSSAESNVTNESSTLTTMYRQTIGLPEAEQTTMRALLRSYTSAARAEWGSTGSGEPTVRSRAAVTDMYRVLGDQRSPAADSINAEIRDQLNVLTSQRNTRILDAKPRIPGLLWSGLLFGAVLLIGLIGFTPLGSRVGHMILSSAIATLLGLLLFLIFWLDHPFGRELGVTPTSLDYAVEVFDGVDHGA